MFVTDAPPHPSCATSGRDEKYNEGVGERGGGVRMEGRWEKRRKGKEMKTVGDDGNEQRRE